jgi:hypothetical protein
MITPHAESHTSAAKGATPRVARSPSVAKVVVLPTVQAATTIGVFDDLIGNPDLSELCQQLKKQVNAANQDDLSSVVAALVSQAATLDTLFNSLCRRAMANVGNFDGFERLLRLGFKAQGQSRATLEAIGRIKNPKSVAFVRQANIANGPLQVNNDPGTSSRKIESVPNELMEIGNEQRLDARAPEEAVGFDSSLAAVGERIRAA